MGKQISRGTNEVAVNDLVRAKEGDVLVCEGWTLQDIDDTWGPDATDRFLQAVLEQKVACLRGD